MKSNDSTGTAAAAPRAYTVAEVASFLSVSDRHLRKMISEGRLRVVRVGRRGLRIPDVELRRFLDDDEPGAGDP